MSGDPLTPIWRRLDRDPPLFFEDQLGPTFGDARERIISLGLLRPATPSGSAQCRECGKGYVGRVEWLLDARTGERAAYLPCPECGPVPVATESLRRWGIEIPTLLAAVLSAARGRGTPAEVVPGHLWHLGNATWCGRPRQASFARCVHASSRPAVVSELTHRPKAVLFVPTEEAVRAWGGATANPVVALESAVTLGQAGITFDDTVVEAELADAGLVGTTTRRKKPIPKNATRAANITKLTQAMIEHLRAARSHATALKSLRKDPELLPRPSKAFLARQTRLLPSTVTLCFQDETARELNLYWEMALDLDQVLKFRGPVGGGAEA